MGIRNVIRRHRRAAIAFAVVIVLGGAFGLYWFQPWKLFTRQTVDEALPGGAVAVAAVSADSTALSPTASSPAPLTPGGSAPAATSSTPQPAPSPAAVASSTPPAAAASSTIPAAVASSTPAPASATVVLAEGTFTSQEHATKGVARVLQLPDGSRIVRLENFSTSDGPDVHIWLSDRPAGSAQWKIYDDGRYLPLGKLKGTDGNQNYAIPAGADLSGFNSVVVWCVRFTVAFGSAPVDL
jgi:Electron transfer DM13